VVLVVVAGTLENFRGHYVWRKYRSEWEGRGERFEIEASVPKPVPAEQNFAGMTTAKRPRFNPSAGDWVWKY